MFICNVVGTMYVLLSYGLVGYKNEYQLMFLCVGIAIIAGLRDSINTLLYFGVVKGNSLWVKIWIVFCVFETCQIAVMLPFLIGQLYQAVEPNKWSAVLYYILAFCCSVDGILHFYHYWIVNKYMLSYLDIIRHLEDRALEESSFANYKNYCLGVGNLVLLPTYQEAVGAKSTAFNYVRLAPQEHDDFKVHASGYI